MSQVKSKSYLFVVPGGGNSCCTTGKHDWLVWSSFHAPSIARDIASPQPSLATRETADSQGKKVVAQGRPRGYVGQVMS